jgi:hypothetical protein
VSRAALTCRRAASASYRSNTSSVVGPQELVHFLARVDFSCACNGSLPSSWLVGGLVSGVEFDWHGGGPSDSE